MEPVTLEYLLKFDEEFKKLDKNTQLRIRRENKNLFNVFKDDLNDFDIEFDETEKCWNVTGYYGRSEEVIFPDSYEGDPFKTIRAEVSPYNKRIIRVTIPEDYTSIGKAAFKNCAGLAEIKLPESLTSIGEWAFCDCAGLTDIQLPENLTSIEDSAFCGCKRLTKVKLPEGITAIGEWVFYDCAGLMDIQLPESLTSIGDSAFYGCTGLINIKFPESLISIEESAFEDCTELTEIKLPESITSIGERAFNGCTGLTNIKLPENLISIGMNAFEFCTKLTEITVDKNNPVFCSVDGVMFDKAMTTLIMFPAGKKGKYSIPDGIIRICSGAFNSCEKLTGISFPQSLLYIDSFRFDCEQLTEITVSELNSYYCSVEGVLFDKGMCTLMEYPINKSQINYAVPDGVKRIDRYAFNNCKRLVNIVLPESLEFIGDYAFSGCEELKAVTLPMNLKYIGERVFKSCPNLKTITLSRKTRIGHRAFEGFGQFIYRD